MTLMTEERAPSTSHIDSMKYTAINGDSAHTLDLLLYPNNPYRFII